jgi:hypothetical protein
MAKKLPVKYVAQNKAERMAFHAARKLFLASKAMWDAAVQWENGKKITGSNQFDSNNPHAIAWQAMQPAVDKIYREMWSNRYYNNYLAKELARSRNELYDYHNNIDDDRSPR